MVAEVLNLFSKIQEFQIDSKFDSQLYKKVLNSNELTPEEEDDQAELQRGRGMIRVTRQVTAYRQIRRYTHETLGYGEVDLPPRAFDTSGYWLSLKESHLAALQAEGIWFGALDYGPQSLWQARRQAARERDQFRCRLCGRPEAASRQHDVHHIRPLRAFLQEATQHNVDPNSIYPQAHALSNLMTLCPSCHRRAETFPNRRTSQDYRDSMQQRLAVQSYMCLHHQGRCPPTFPGLYYRRRDRIRHDSLVPEYG